MYNKIGKMDRCVCKFLRVTGFFSCILLLKLLLPDNQKIEFYSKYQRSKFDKGLEDFECDPCVGMERKITEI